MEIILINIKNLQFLTCNSIYCALITINNKIFILNTIDKLLKSIFCVYMYM